MFKLMSFMAM